MERVKCLFAPGDQVQLGFQSFQHIVFALSGALDLSNILSMRNLPEVPIL